MAHQVIDPSWEEPRISQPRSHMRGIHGDIAGTIGQDACYLSCGLLVGWERFCCEEAVVI